jgi:hypothetical protein
MISGSLGRERVKYGGRETDCAAITAEDKVEQL